eukprot:XP_001702621.1 predicted protein [Chlamydomonas reinhardtii]
MPSCCRRLPSPPAGSAGRVVLLDLSSRPANKTWDLVPGVVVLVTGYPRLGTSAANTTVVLVTDVYVSRGAAQLGAGADCGVRTNARHADIGNCVNDYGPHGMRVQRKAAHQMEPSAIEAQCLVVLTP